MWRCLRYLRPYWQMTLGVYAAMVLIQAINLAVPQFVRWIIDEGIYGGNLRLLGLAVAGLLGISAGKGVLIYFQGAWSEVASQNVAYDLRNAIQRKLNQLSFSFHDQAESGQILSRSIQDVERVRFLTGRALLRILEGALLMFGTAAVLVSMNARLGFLVVLTLPFIVHRAYVFGRTFRPLSLQIQDQLAVLTTRIEQNLRGAQIVKSFAQEEAEITRFIEDNEAWFGLSYKAARLQAVNEPLLNLIANLGTVAILWYGGLLVADGGLSLGELVAFVTYLAQLVRPLNLLGRIVPMLSIAASGGERLFEILDSQPAIQDHPQALELPSIRGLVQFERVSFGYNSHQVLEDISFTVQPGQVVALIGATGSGKSTIINLAARFYDPNEGRVTIDGHDARRIQVHSLRSQTGIVLQETRLFAASIWENIAFGAPEADEAAIIAAARDAQAHDFILAMPEGYDTVVGERGVTLSGGQKQRIAIARALLTDPRILILDDATSSVDTETEHHIQIALERLMEGRTTFVIAHRLSTVRRADLILVLENRRIAAQGTHAQLLQESPLYAEIYQLQLRPLERAR